MTRKRPANLALWEPSAVLAMVERRIGRLPWLRERLKLERRLAAIAEAAQRLLIDIDNFERELA